VVFAVGAGLTAAVKLRAARHARRRVSRDLVGVENHGVAPSLAPPETGGLTPADGGLSLVGTADGLPAGATTQTPLPVASPNLTATAETAPTLRTSRARSVTPAPPAVEPRRGARGATTTTVLEALAGGGVMTAAEVALATGLGRPTVSSALSRLVRTGAVAKAERGYQLPDVTPLSQPEAKERASKPVVRRTRSKRATSTRTSAPARSRGAGGSPVAAVPSPPAAGATKAKVLTALSTDVGLTAGEVATATGLARGTVSTTLSRLAKSGEIVKAERGYRLPA
jgi:DNA-binding transcriptional ArsR family regulator